MSSEAEVSPLQKLVESFHSLLDEPLIVAIACDHDLQSISGYESAYAILQGLAQNVPSEEATGFNPSGTFTILEDSERVKDNATATTSSLSEHASQAHRADSSNTSHSSSNSDSEHTIPRLVVFNNSSEEGKILQLQGLFPDLKEYDIEFSLKKARGDFQTALDDLLNVQYLQSSGQQVKGIDGFFHLDDPTVGRKKKKKGKGQVDQGLHIARDHNTPLNHMKEFKDQSEIAHISERFNISFDEVSVIYYEKDCSNSATVVEILDQHISHKGAQPLDETGQKIADSLARKYRNVPTEYMRAIIQLSGSMPRFSDDLAALANKHFSKRPRSQRFDLSYRLTPLPNEEIEGLQRSPTSKGSVSGIGGGNRWASPPTSPNAITDLSLAVQVSENFSQARRDAAESAARLHRKGASNPLYRQAASYYADRAREQARYAQEAMSTAADLLVEQQSTEEVVDLHGVSVHDGVRIARQKAMDWWGNHAEFRGKLRDHSLTIITGIGRHSAGGVSQLRKAVAAALLQDGWKLRVETGKFVITGR